MLPADQPAADLRLVRFPAPELPHLSRAAHLRHLDIFIGKSAARDVFPMILEELEAKSVG